MEAPEVELATQARQYPQMPPLTEEGFVSLLQTQPIARLATHNPDGTIHVVPVWFKYVDGNILLGTQAVPRKVKNVERDADVTVLIDDPEMPAKGAMIYGTQRSTPTIWSPSGSRSSTDSCRTKPPRGWPTAWRHSGNRR
jgi:hypothetical protein